MSMQKTAAFFWTCIGGASITWCFISTQQNNSWIEIRHFYHCGCRHRSWCDELMRMGLTKSGLCVKGFCLSDYLVYKSDFISRVLGVFLILKGIACVVLSLSCKMFIDPLSLGSKLSKLFLFLEEVPAYLCLLVVGVREKIRENEYYNIRNITLHLNYKKL